MGSRSSLVLSRPLNKSLSCSSQPDVATMFTSLLALVQFLAILDNFGIMSLPFCQNGPVRWGLRMWQKSNEAADFGQNELIGPCQERTMKSRRMKI